MKILHVIASVDPKNGGPIENLKQLLAELSESKHQNDVACLDSEDASWIKEFPHPVFALGGKSAGTYSYSTSFKKWIEEHAKDYDAIIIRGLWQYHGLASSRAAKAASVPYYVFPHGMLDPWFKEKYPLKHLKKTLYWKLFEQKVIENASGILFTSEAEKRKASQSFPGYRAKEFVVKYGSAGPRNKEEAERSFLKIFPQLRDKKFLLFLGRIHEKKGCDLLIRAYSEMESPNFDLVFAGPDHQNLLSKELVKLKGNKILSQIHQTGMLDEELRWGALSAAEALVLPSHQENFGMVVAEALACGTPSLISKQVDIWESIEKNCCGFVGEDSLADTKKILSAWSAATQEDKNNMKENAQRCFKENFSIKEAAKSLVSILERKNS